MSVPGAKDAAGEDFMRRIGALDRTVGQLEPSDADPAGEVEIIVTLPKDSPASVTEDIHVDSLLASGVAPHSIDAKVETQLRPLGIAPELLETHGAATVGTLRRINTVVLKAPSEAAEELIERLRERGLAARPGATFELKDEEKKEEDVGEGVGLKRVSEVLRADKLQAELKKTLGEPRNPREAPEDAPKSAFGSVMQKLAAVFRRVFLGVALVNPALPWAILDTWVQGDHPYLRGRLEKNVVGEMDNEIHGTHTAGTVIGVDIFNFSGRAYNMLPNGHWREGEALMALNRAVEEGALATTNSWGSPYGDPEDEVVKLFMALAEEGVHHNIAAGNDGRDGSDSVGSPGVAYHFTDLVLGGRIVGKAKRIKTIAAADEELKTADFSSRGPGSWTTATNTEEYNDYPAKPDEAGVGVKVVAPVPTRGVEVPELGGMGRRLNGTSMSTPGAFGAFLLLTRGILVLLKDYLPKLPDRELKLFAMDLARYSMTATAKKVAPRMEQGDGFIDVWAAFEHSAALLKASNRRVLPKVRELFRRVTGLGGYGRKLVRKTRAWLRDPSSTAPEPDPGPKPPFLVQRPVAKYKAGGAINGLAQSLDRKAVFVATMDGSVKRLNLETGEAAWTFTGQSGMLKDLLLLKDGSRVASAADDNTVRILDAETGGELLKLKGFARGAMGLAQSPDGKRLFVAAGSGQIHMIDVETGQEIRRFAGHKDPAFAVTVSADGKYMFSGGADKAVRMWDVETGEELKIFRDPGEWIYSVAVSPDGKRLFMGSDRVRIWDIESGTERRELIWKDGSWVMSMAVSPDGRHVFAGLQDAIGLMWDTDTGRKEALFRGHKALIPSMQLDAERKRLITGGDDSRLIFWEVPEPAPSAGPAEPDHPAERDEELDPIALPGQEDVDEGPGGSKKLIPDRYTVTVLGAETAGRAPRAPVEALLKTSDVLLVGENHTSFSSIEWMIENLKQLKGAGVTTVALESLELPEEKAVNRFLRGETDVLPDFALQLPEGREDPMRRLYEAMRAEGMRVVALQKPSMEWLPKIAKLAAKYTGMPRAAFADLEKLAMFMSLADYRYVRGLNEAIAEVAMTRRNKFMARRLKAKLAPGEKAVLLAGYGHLGHPEGFGPDKIYGVPRADYGDLALELGRALLGAFSLTLTGGRFMRPEDAAGDRHLKAREYEHLGRALPDGRPAYVETSGRSGIYHLGGPVKSGG